MTTFDGWETRLYGDAMALPAGNELMHFRTKGSKNGVRRYQTESGEWTPLGLKERKAREGWGQSRRERKAAKQVAKAERKAAKAEKRTARVSARKERMAAVREKKRLGDITKLTDEELKQRLARVKMEQEYREMTRSPLLKTGERLLNTVLDYKARQTEAKASLAKATLDNNRVKADIIKAREGTKVALAEKEAAKYGAKTAKAEAKKQQWDAKGGLKYKRKADLTNAKTAKKGTTIWGALGKAANNNAKYRQEVRMNPIEAKKAERTRALQKLQNEKAAQATEQEKHKSDQERWKARQKGYRGNW